MLKVNEIFSAIQGEGKSQGLQVVFLRLAFCNLHCNWCDTPYTWNWKGTNFTHKDKYDINSEVHLMDTDKVISKLKSFGIKSIVISGGEPFLQQKSLFPVVEQLKKEGFWIEIETNGTIFPNHNFIQMLDQINCSPKLQNSGNLLKIRIVPKVLEVLTSNNKTNFKFVISCRKDVIEALVLIKKYIMKEIYFMPEGRTKVEIERSTAYVKELTEQCKVHFTTRQHILNFGDKRGV